MEDLKNNLDRVLDYLSPLLALANSHPVDFIVNDTWSKLVPEEIRTEVEQLGTDSVLDDAFEGTNSVAKFCLRAADFVIEKSTCFKDINELDAWHSNFLKPVKINEFMSDKKLHEVQRTSAVIGSLATLCDANLIIDIGSGKGYLSSVLALHHHLRVLGVDCSSTNMKGAIRTTTKLERKWKVYEKNAAPCTDGVISQQNTCKIAKTSCSSNEEYYERYKWRSAIVGSSYKQRVEKISEQTNVKALINEEYPDEEAPKVLLVGLHTCGNLASNCLKLFIDNLDTVECVVNVGCCYHLLDEEFVSDPAWHRSDEQRGLECGFPMSWYLKENGFKLGRDARMCGTQNPAKIFKDHELVKATKPLFYRALLQELLLLSLGPDNQPSTIVGRIAHKCNTFQEYATKAFKKLDVQIEISEDELLQFAEKYTTHWERLKIFFLLKTALSSVIENVILMDRLLYLFEEGIVCSLVTRLFDPVISPRCYAIIASKNHLKGTTIAEEEVCNYEKIQTD